MSIQPVQSVKLAARQLRIAIVLFLLMLVTGAVGIYFAATADFLNPDDRAMAGIEFVAAAIVMLFAAMFFYARSEGWSRRNALLFVGGIAVLLAIFAAPGGLSKIISMIFYWPLDLLGR